MRFGNPALQKIYDNVVAPTMNNIHYDVEGYIYGVNYENQTVDIFWKELGGSTRQVKDVPFPKEADGVFKQNIKIGDMATIAFKNNDLSKPYITVIYKSNPNKDDFVSKYGGGIPRGIGYY